MIDVNAGRPLYKGDKVVIIMAKFFLTNVIRPQREE
jgi:hypothetical protein